MRPGRAADHSPLLVPRSWKSRAIYISTHPVGHTGPVKGALYLLLSLLACNVLRVSEAPAEFFSLSFLLP